MSRIDDLIHEHALKLLDIYDSRTAGAYTFTGVLAEFGRQLLAVAVSEVTPAVLLANAVRHQPTAVRVPADGHKGSGECCTSGCPMVTVKP